MAEIDLRHLQYFVAAAESRSFVKAARLVNVSQPAVTKSIQRMEQWLGQPLFHRGGELRLSEFGEVLLPEARRVLENFDELRRTAENFGSARASTVRIGAGPLMAETLVGTAVGRLIAKNPNVRVTIQVDDYHIFPAMLLERKIDLFVADVTELGETANLAIRKLKPSRMRWFCRKKHPLSRRKNVTFAEVLSYPVVLPELPIWAREWFAGQMPNDRPLSGAHPPFRPTAVCSHFPTLRDMVIESDAISALTEPVLLREPYASEVSILSFRGETPWSNPGIVTRGRQVPPAAVGGLIEELIKVSEKR
jgi:DNA-binding transcriptional LysR family regulator